MSVCAGLSVDRSQCSAAYFHGENMKPVNTKVSWEPYSALLQPYQCGPGSITDTTIRDGMLSPGWTDQFSLPTPVSPLNETTMTEMSQSLLVTETFGKLLQLNLYFKCCKKHQKRNNNI